MIPCRHVEVRVAEWRRATNVSALVVYLMRDSRGFMWFCARDGLSRFDGYQFINYKLGDDPSQANVTYLFETRKGIYWIATNRGRLIPL